jgi:hypothetical protein
MKTADEIYTVISAKIRAEAASFVCEPTPTDVRPYRCSIEGCSRHGYAKGLCNAHYMRKHKGIDMHKPIQNNRRRKLCQECQKPTGDNGAWGRCATHYRRKRLSIMKNAVVELFGGACMTCSGVFPARVFDLHHLGEKAISPSYAMTNMSIRNMAEEISKCVLLCANCHRLEHNDGSYEGERQL